ncbi:hypothetical protein [Prochlorococcus sp. MIT 1223]|uniref:hypothetical protein n=1 Tax=Prochlorococcus sp. MIT 1223 TaxID=3096217 RepID=UPI002A75695A|nr:hypothetical protein [Prochlorococcus sp. MIT 1223]
MPSFHWTPTWIRKTDFCTRRFTPDYFLNQPGGDRPIDIIYIGRINKMKNSLKIASFVKKLNLKTVFIGFYQGGEDSYYQEFLDVVNSSDNINYINGTGIRNADFWGTSQREISEYLKQSKVYIHGCVNEGESRSIHEAFLSGCILLIPKNMKGGGLDYYNQLNYSLYEDDTIYVSLIEAINKSKYFRDLPESHSKLLDSNSIALFKDKVKSLLPDIDKSEDGWDTEKLNLKLCAHYLNIPWYKEGSVTADIYTSESLQTFLSYNCIE